MPELPEVETITRELRPKIRGRMITDCVIIRQDVIAHPKPAQFCKAIVGEKIINVSRKAKYLILELGNKKRLVFHLRLSGTIAVIPLDLEPQKFSRLVLVLNDCQLLFNEPRVLGRVYLISSKERPPILKGFYKLGCEPISDDFTTDYLKARLKNRKARIKSLLLDQNICAGMGNIYSDEALFRAGIRPLRRANRITNKELEKLTKALRDVIAEGISNFGTSVSDYTRTDGKNGNFQNFLCVYGREGEPCKKCGTKIALKKIGNRGTRYCPKCQH
ncbi:MAG: bifunctional DNA-formamidopyrimidine glycosylase/DNA-(apurinic or apyrimidinic site) lyase [candidate division WOR-3 bacterium]|nr:MAG: bifunctional DNA-formamidopyrimidine glycosylase/DNA-(apurinic or apyrimidinic site) lyase [candidate division WOR-3 bacterium]